MERLVAHAVLGLIVVNLVVPNAVTAVCPAPVLFLSLLAATRTFYVGTGQSARGYSDNGHSRPPGVVFPELCPEGVSEGKAAGRYVAEKYVAAVKYAADAKPYMVG